MMTKLDDDREKPINLFLTIKKKVFEDLKSSSENFSNKLYCFQIFFFLLNSYLVSYNRINKKFISKWRNSLYER